MIGGKPELPCRSGAQDRSACCLRMIDMMSLVSRRWKAADPHLGWLFLQGGGVSGVCQSTVSGDKVQFHAVQQRTVSPEHVQRLSPSAGDPYSMFAVVIPFARTPLV